MRKELRVIQNEVVIYTMDFPIDEPWQFAKFAKIALEEFHLQFPNVSLAAPGVSMQFTETDRAERSTR